MIVEVIIKARANVKASALVQRTNEHMALEGQKLSSQQIQFEIDRLQRDMINTMPFDLWDDEQ